MPDPEISVRLPQSVLLALLASLGHRPYDEVHSLIETIVAQAAPQVAELQLADARAASPREQ